MQKIFCLCLYINNSNNKGGYMFVQSISFQNDKTCFNGKIGKATLIKAKQYLPKEDYNNLKNARFGKNQFTNVELIRENIISYDGLNRNNVQNNLYAVITNLRKKLPPVKINLGSGDMPVDRMFFARLSNAVINGENILSKLKS